MEWSSSLPEPTILDFPRALTRHFKSGEEKKCCRIWCAQFGSLDLRSLFPYGEETPLTAMDIIKPPASLLAKLFLRLLMLRDFQSYWRQGWNPGRARGGIRLAGG